MAGASKKMAEAAVLSETEDREEPGGGSTTETGAYGAEGTTGSGEDTSADDGMVVFRIPKGRDSQSRRDVFVGLNGRPYLIKRGEYVKMPKAIAEILQHQEEQLDYADSVMEQASYEEQ